MAEKESLTNREYIGIILPDKDSTHRGWYKVNVPELQPHMKDSTGIWCQNHTCKHRVSPSQAGVSGSYIPLQAGMSVVVKCFANDIESAYIERVLSDQYTNSLPYEIIERDDYYQVIRTPKHNNLIAIYESDIDSKNVPKNSIHVYFNDARTTVVIDETGINVKTADNINVTIGIKAKITAKITVVGTADIHVTGATKLKCDATVDIKSSGALKVESGATIDIKSGGIMNIQGGGDINIQGGSNINLNCGGAAASAANATDATAPTLITASDYEYFTRTSGS